MDLTVHCRGQGLGELIISMDRVDAEHSSFEVGCSVELPDQSVAIQNREGEVAPPTLGRWFVHLQLVVELEYLRQALAIDDEAVQGRQQRGPSAERLVQLVRVHPPSASYTFNHGRFTGFSNVLALDRALRTARASYAERGETSLVPNGVRLGERHRRGVGID